MTTKIKDIYTWMDEIANSRPEAFAEYFYSEIMDYVFPESYDDSAELADEDSLSESMRKKLLKCSSETEVKNWMDDIASEIVMKIDTEQIISEHLA